MSPVSIAADLRRSLLSGSLRPGAELSQVELAERFGVSRIPVRDALRILEGEGLIVIEPNRGARALSLSPEEVREIYELRLLLECDALRRAMATITDSEIEEIDRVRKRTDLEARTPRWSEGDMEFHAAMYRLANRKRQIAMIEGLRRTCQLFVSAYAAMPARTPRWLADHRAIVRKIRERDVEGAVDALRAHISDAMEHLLDQMGQALAGPSEAKRVGQSL